MVELTQAVEGALREGERLLRWLAIAGGVVLAALMLLVSAAVFCRYVLNQPILGDQELVEIGMSVVVMMAMPFAALKGAHIRIDILDRAIGRHGRFWGDVFARLVSCYVLFLLIRKTWDKMLDAHKYGDVTNMIEIPVWITYAAITGGMGLFSAILAAQLIGQFRQGVTCYQ